MLDQQYEEVLKALQQDQIERVRRSLQQNLLDITISDDQILELYQAANGNISHIVKKILSVVKWKYTMK